MRLQFVRCERDSPVMKSVDSLGVQSADQLLTGFPVQVADLRPGWVFTKNQVAWSATRHAYIVLASKEGCYATRVTVKLGAPTMGGEVCLVSHQKVFLQCVIGDGEPVSESRIEILARRIGQHTHWRLCDWLYAVNIAMAGRPPHITREQLKLLKSGSVQDNGWAMGLYAGKKSMASKRALWQALSDFDQSGLVVDWVEAPPVWEKCCKLVQTPVGLGVQATRYIEADEVLGVYSGHWMRNAPEDEDALFTLTATEPWQVDGRFVRSMGCMLNGSCCRTNVCISVYAVEGLDGSLPALFGLAVCSTEAIKAGDAVFMGYGPEYFDSAGFPCNGMHCDGECSA